MTSGNIYGLRSGEYYLRTAENNWRRASAYVQVGVRPLTEALTIKAIDPIPFGIAGRWTGDITLEAIGGTAPYTWTILTQPFFVDTFNKQYYTSQTNLHTYYPGNTATFNVQFPNSTASNLGRMRVRVTDANGGFAELPITFEGYKDISEPDYRNTFTLNRNSARQDFSSSMNVQKPYTYEYDPIPKSEAMIVTLQNLCGDNDYAIQLNELSFDTTNSNGDALFDVYIDPAFGGTELKRYEEIDLYLTPKTGVDVSNGWPFGYPVVLRVTYRGNTVSLNDSRYFKVVPHDLSTCTVDTVAPQTCYGTAVTPELRIFDGKRYLTEDDYYVEWTDNEAVGTAGYTVRAKRYSLYEGFDVGTGNYTGSLSGTFEIIRVEIPEFTVTFDANAHGTAPAAQTVTLGSKAVMPAAPEENGWTFTGWYIDAACTAEFDFDITICDDMTVYAGWNHIAHTGGTATCIARAVCEICGQEYGELGEHHPTENGVCDCCGRFIFPVITAQPENVTVTEGDSANFNVAATGEGLSYQWQYNANKGKAPGV